MMIFRRKHYNQYFRFFGTALKLKESTSHSKEVQGLSFTLPDYYAENKLATLSLTLPFGSRCENYNEKGLSHLLKCLAYKSSSKMTQMTITRSSEIYCTPLQSNITRENLTLYTDSPIESLPWVMEVFSNSLFNTDYSAHELEQALEMAAFETKFANKNVHFRLMEAMHGLVFRNLAGLGQPLLVSDWRVSGIKEKEVSSFKKRLLSEVPLKYALVGINIDSKLLKDLEDEFLLSQLSNFRSKHPAIHSKSSDIGHTGFGNGELFIEDEVDDGYHLAYGFPTPGYSHSSYPSLLVLSALIFGDHCQPSIPFGKPSGLLATAHTKNTHLTPIHSFYSDAGLLGFHLNSDDHSLLYESSAHLVRMLSNSVEKLEEKNLNMAKNTAKFIYSKGIEPKIHRIEEITRQLLSKEKYSNMSEVFKSIDATSIESLQKLMKELLKAQPSVVIYGSHLKGDSFLTFLSSSPTQKKKLL